MNCRIKKRKETLHDRGFSLVEMIISLVIGGIMIAAIAPIFNGNAKSFYKVTAGNESIQAARIGFNRMMSDLRDIAGSSSITSGTASSITFSSVESTPMPVISYALSGNTITRTKTGIPGAVLIPNVSSFSIQYYNNLNAPVTSPVSSPTNVWSIRITLTVNVAGQSMTFQSTVNPRNMPYM